MGGYTYHFRTGAINALTENLGSSFPTCFDVQYYEEADNEVKEIRLLPRILTETREGVAAERWLNAYGKSGEDFAASLQTTADKGYVVVGKTTSFGAGSPNAWVAYIGKDGKIPGCPAMGASGSKVRNTQATIQNTSVTGKNTSAAPKTSQAKSPAASSTVTEICTESQ